MIMKKCEDIRFVNWNGKRIYFYKDEYGKRIDVRSKEEKERSKQKVKDALKDIYK